MSAPIRHGTRLNFIAQMARIGDIINVCIFTNGRVDKLLESRSIGWSAIRDGLHSNFLWCVLEQDT